MSALINQPRHNNETADLLDECVAIGKALRQLQSAGVRASFFMSTDRGPEVWVFPSGALNHFIVGKKVLREQKISPVKTDVLCEVALDGVALKWLETRYFNPRKAVLNGEA